MKQATLIYDLKLNMIHLATREEDTSVWQIKDTRLIMLSPCDMLNMQVSALECCQFTSKALKYCNDNNYEYIGLTDKEKIGRVTHK